MFFGINGGKMGFVAFRYTHSWCKRTQLPVARHKIQCRKEKKSQIFVILGENENALIKQDVMTPEGQGLLQPHTASS